MLWIIIFTMHGKIHSSLPYITVKLILISYISMNPLKTTEVFWIY